MSPGTAFLVWECADQSHSRPDCCRLLWSLRSDRRCSPIPSGHCPIRSELPFKVPSPPESAASPLGDARIFLRRLGMSLALCPSQKSLDPLYALPRYRPLSLLTWIRRLCPRLSMRPPLLRSEDWDRSHSQSHSGVSRCRVGVLQLCTSLANCQTGAPQYPMRESESLRSP